jgi:DNA polymerase lambda
MESKKGTVSPGSSKLCLEVKERVAKHVAMKQRDRVISSGPQNTESLIPIRQVMGSGLLKEGFTSEQTSIPLVSSSPHPEEADHPPKPKVTQRSRAPFRAPKHKTTKKEKQAPISPIEYARQLVERTATANKPKNPNTQFLEGKFIFYIGGDMQFASERTRKRMDLVCHSSLTGLSYL